MRIPGALRTPEGLDPVATDDGVTSPRLGIRMALVDGQLLAWRPDGTPFRSFEELDREAAEARAEIERARDEAERARAAVEAMRERMRKLGLDPDAPD